MSDDEKALVNYSIEHLDSQFIVNKLFDAFRGQWTHHRITKLAKAWESRGWLTTPQHATDSRKITKSLIELL